MSILWCKNMYKMYNVALILKSLESAGFVGSILIAFLKYKIGE